MFVEQLAEAPVPVSAQTSIGVKVTLPDGVLVIPGDVSVTVAEQVVSWPSVRVDRDETSWHADNPKSGIDDCDNAYQAYTDDARSWTGYSRRSRRRRDIYCCGGGGRLL